MTSELNKADLVQDIAKMLGVEAPRMSTGSTEPKAIFTLANDRLGLGLDSRLGKPNLARAIVESAGFPWHPEYESRGATVTRKGLAAVHEAVSLFTGH